jgi:hypothetical protein
VIQLKSPILENDLAEQIVKNLAFMAKLLKTYDYNNESGEIESLKHNINVEWLIKKVIKEANYELVNKPKETIKVRCVFSNVHLIQVHSICFLFDTLEILYFQMVSCFDT